VTFARYQVKDVARMSGVSVRTLHHYDEIGLLSPCGRTEAGYRLYSQDALLRLQQILIGRELGLSLEEIRRSIDDPAFDRRRALLAQREQLQHRAAQAAAMIKAVDAALAMLPDAAPGAPMDMKAIFDGFDPSRHEAEARERWGSTDAYKTSQERVGRYNTSDWDALKAEQAGVYADAAAAMQAGRAPADAIDVAERHRMVIDRWFYPCSREMHLGLADLYESDERFAATIDAHAAGLTAFLVAAIRANAAR
jgi:MerR family transcriptional regulator, thiopeptide resistance regulator